MAKGTLASFATTRKSASSVASGKAKAGLTGSTATKKAGTTTAAPTAGQNTSSSKKAKVEQSVLPSSEGDDVVQVNRDGTARRKLKPNDRKYQKLYGEYMEENLGEFPLLHGDDHSKVDFILRQFDLAPEYGPAAGMTRLQRWERASKWGLDPPEEVHEILTTTEGLDKAEYRESLFDGRV